MKRKIEDIVQDGKYKTASELKKSVFDVVAIAIVMAIVLASLDVFDLCDFTLMTFGDFVVGWVPYFLATILLTMDLYKKGVFVGKSTDKFIAIAKSYSGLVNDLSGKQIKELSTFCEKYNEDALVNLRTSILKEEGISYEDFDEGPVLDGIKRLPLKIWTKEELTNNKYTKAQIKAIAAAKKAKIKGINVNILLSSMSANDPTNIGKGEAELEKRILASSVFKYLISTLLMSLIAIKDISQWGWASLILVSFKVIYMFARSFMAYFNGYDNITVSIANHLTRKTDILKMYLDYTPEVINETMENAVSE